jgi:3-deoxy-D-manno-octulosonic-acid transferase
VFTIRPKDKELFLYYYITKFFHHIAPILFYYRLHKGKEDKDRLSEKFGLYHHAIKRPYGFVVRIHGASVGETLSALPLIDRLLEYHPDIHIMVTSNTLTSAKVMKNKLPNRCFHIYAPLDTPQAVQKFYAFYKPDLEIILDSEIFPNALAFAHNNKIPVFGVNTRLSDKSMTKWQKIPQFFTKILSAYQQFFVQNEKIAAFLQTYFTGKITVCDNLKWGFKAPTISHSLLLPLKNNCQNRFVLCLLSTHNPEEIEIVTALEKQGFFYDKNNLLIIVPRHPNRKQDIINDLKIITNATLGVRSQTLTIDDSTQIYLCDTLGEIMLWASVADFIFMGHSFSTQGGGHNPIEPACIGKPIIVGNKIHNFTEIYAILKNHDACVFASDTTECVQKIMILKSRPDLCHRLAMNSKNICNEYRQKSLMFVNDINTLIFEMKRDAKP